MLLKFWTKAIKAYACLGVFYQHTLSKLSEAQLEMFPGMQFFLKDPPFVYDQTA